MTGSINHSFSFGHLTLTTRKKIQYNIIWSRTEEPLEEALVAACNASMQRASHLRTVYSNH